MPAPSADEPPGAPRSIWVLAAMGAILIHGFAALALGYLRPEEVSDDLGAPAIVVGVELEAPHRDAADLPPGPDSEALMASPEVAEQKTVVKETDLPKATPTETDDPDLSPNYIKRPDDDIPEKPAVETAPSNASIAAEAMAMPSPETAQEAPRSTAPDLGTGESLRRERATWQKEVAVHLEKYKRLSERPPRSVEIVVRFVLDRTGHVVSAEVAKSSGDAAFDDAALAMMKRADPLPAPPPLVADDGLTFSMPVSFRGKGPS
jgi:TonB family protein